MRYETGQSDLIQSWGQDFHCQLISLFISQELKEIKWPSPSVLATRMQPWCLLSNVAQTWIYLVPLMPVSVKMLRACTSINIFRNFLLAQYKVVVFAFQCTVQGQKNLIKPCLRLCSAKWLNILLQNRALELRTDFREYVDNIIFKKWNKFC